MKKVLKIFLYILLAIVVFAIVFVLAEFSLSSMESKAKVSSLPKNIKVFVKSNDVHTDLVFPVKNDQINWESVFPTSNNIGKDSVFSYIGIGWGDKGFYLNTPEWKDLKVSTALVAATGIGETALHVTYYKQVDTDDLTYSYMIDSVQYEALIDYVKNSLDHDAQNKAILINTTAQYDNTDAFYEAKGAYSLFHSCNTWANNGLKKAGMPAAVWTIRDKGILGHYKKIN